MLEEFHASTYWNLMERCAILFADSSGLSSVPEGGAVRAQSRRSGVLHCHVAIAVFLWLICVWMDVCDGAFWFLW